jgi:gamma-glutamylcyclotransferase (GGCT)/AIG2-like uncharacterized protein YtfP
VLLFVYGTLRRGGSNHARLEGCRFRRPATVRGSLYDLGAYPALVLGTAGEVQGEIWCCPPETLLALDAYEGVHEELFSRVRLPLPEGTCWAYVAGARLAPLLTPEALSSSPRWLPRRETGRDP